ncbi:MAG TPA: type VI secretion system contractile sheath large subunit, partial [Dongiaceae bacterium]|nr:type VI secretion system contractile sheath large subunit [Dongiaceae bacterium]
HYLQLVAPRFLLRLPYGKRTSPINAFPFEELPEKNAHGYYLWGNGAWLVTLVLADARSQGKGANPSAEVDGLPIHIHQAGGESDVTPCAEVALTDRAASALAAAGLSVIRSVLNQDKVRVTGHRLLGDTTTPA